MPWQAHPRIITDHQFADNTTIDGSRLDAAMEDIVQRVNNVRRGDIRTRWLESQSVSAWTPQDPGSVGGIAHHKFPWMHAFNDTGAVASTSQDPDRFTNEQRAKGYAVSGINSTDGASVTGQHWIWTQKFFVNKPAVLVDWSIFLTTDHPAGSNIVFDNDFLFTALAPDGFSNGDDTEDLTLIISVDSEFDREDKSRGDMELHRFRFQINKETVSHIVWPTAGFNDAFPNGFPGSSIHGIYIPLKVYIPLHQRSRVQSSIIIPDYNGGVSGWDPTPWYNQYVSSTRTMLNLIV